MGSTKYITSMGDLKRKDDSLCFRKGNKNIYLPVENVKEIYCLNEISLNTKLLDFISSKNIIIHFFNYYQGYSGTFYPKDKYTSGKLLIKQVEAFSNHRKEIARAIVHGIAINIYETLYHYYKHGKKEVKETIQKLKEYGVTTKIITGDNQYATQNICNLVGIENNEILIGAQVDNLSDEELAKKVESVNVFARMNPLQKERIIKTLKSNGHVVGYMGDGVNDAPSLHNADVGICVDTATDIAKEASDIILLEKSLSVIYNGVIEGRKVYGNIIKYMKMALSSDFGDVFSIFLASIFLPFLPLLPIQMLIQDFLYDFSQIAIPYDDVDKEFLIKPRKWDTKGLGRFMNVMGPVSSIIDVLAFLAFWFMLGYNSTGMESYFQTAWFVECLISETLIIHFVRTEKIPFIQSRANPILMVLTTVTIVGTIITPILLHNIQSFHFEILPLSYYLIIVWLLIAYIVIVQIVKKWYIKKYGAWL